MEELQKKLETLTASVEAARGDVDRLRSEAAAVVLGGGDPSNVEQTIARAENRCATLLTAKAELLRQIEAEAAREGTERRRKAENEMLRIRATLDEEGNTLAETLRAEAARAKRLRELVEQGRQLSNGAGVSSGPLGSWQNFAVPYLMNVEAQIQNIAETVDRYRPAGRR